MSSIAPKCFCLCAGDFIKCSCPDPHVCSKCRAECQPTRCKKKRLSVALSDVSNASGTDRFQFVSKEAEEDLQKGFVPGNTQRSTQWAMKVFSDWKKAREAALEEACPEDLLERANPEDLVRWLSLFAAEARNGKGDHYTPTTISSLLAGLLRTMRSLNPSAPNFMDKKDHRFKLLLHLHLHHFQLLRQKSWIRFWKASQDFDSKTLKCIPVSVCCCVRADCIFPLV